MNQPRYKPDFYEEEHCTYVGQVDQYDLYISGVNIFARYSSHIRNDTGRVDVSNTYAVISAADIGSEYTELLAKTKAMLTLKGIPHGQ
jgi:hypothetical protein